MSIPTQNSAQISHPQHYLNSNKDSDFKESILEQEEEKVLGKILGIDFGQSKIGLALADTETRMAFAYDTLTNDQKFQEKLSEIVAKENVEKIIIGIPSYINSKEESAGEKLGKIIEKELQISVEYQDEMFTTKMAKSNLIESGAKAVDKNNDAEAARIILQSWLDKTV
jgi:putative Holliday junction resolvase